jgi:hypothetical protein
MSDFKKISPRVRYVVSCEEELNDVAPSVSAFKVAEGVVSAGAKKINALPAEERGVSHIMKGGEKIEPVPRRFLINSEHGVCS